MSVWIQFLLYQPDSKSNTSRRPLLLINPPSPKSLSNLHALNPGFALYQLIGSHVQALANCTGIIEKQK